MCPPRHSIACPRQQPPGCIHVDRTLLRLASPLPYISHHSKKTAPLPIANVNPSQDLDKIFKVIRNTPTSFYPRLKSLLHKRMAWIFSRDKRTTGTKPITCWDGHSAQENRLIRGNKALLKINVFGWFSYLCLFCLQGRNIFCTYWGD